MPIEAQGTSPRKVKVVPLNLARRKLAASASRPATRCSLRADPDRSEDLEEPLLCSSPLHGLRGREAVDAGTLPCDESRGGWAAVCTEYCAVSLDADEMPAVSARLWDEDDVHSLRLMCDEVHEHGALAGVDLHHSGAHG